ncbi:DMT family transporter (plasmid) [Marinovum sp. KMM 9989]
MNDNTRGILFMILAMATMLTSDTVVKRVAQELPLFQVIFIRHIFMTVGLGVMAFRDGALRFRPTPQQTRLVTLRTIGECGIVCFYMIALTMMPLGTGTALFQLQPLAVTLAAALFLSQPIGPRRMMAIIVGFGGVLLIVRPGTEAFSLGAVFTLLAVVCVCLRDITTRILGASVPASVLAVMGSTALLVLSFVIMMVQGNWAPVSLGQLGLIFAGASFLLVGYLAMVFAMRFGDIAAISPFRYVALVFGILYGFLFFGEVPQPIMLLGASIIVASGLYSFLRERTIRAKAGTTSA